MLDTADTTFDQEVSATTGNERRNCIARLDRAAAGEDRAAGAGVRSGKAAVRWLVAIRARGGIVRPLPALQRPGAARRQHVYR